MIAKEGIYRPIEIRIGNLIPGLSKVTPTNMDIGDLHLVGDRTSLAFPLVGDSRYVFVNSYDVKS